MNANRLILASIKSSKSKFKYKLPVDGLKESWDFENIYVNPPYGKYKGGSSIYNWLEKGIDANIKYGSTLLYLIPVSTNTKHFKDLIFKYGNGISFLHDTRLKFYYNGIEYSKGAPMACCMVLIGGDYDLFESVFSKNGYCIKIKKGI